MLTTGNESTGSTPSEESRKRLRVLLSAYACEPDRGSEQGVGWEAARALSRRHYVTVVTDTRYRASIEQWLERHPDDPAARIDFQFLGSPKVLGRELDHRLLGENLHYLLWQGLLSTKVRELQGIQPFDVAQHLTYVRYWMPSGLAGVPGLPWVFGPVGGGDTSPPELRATLGPGGRASEAVRDFVRWIFSRLPTVGRAAASSSVALATTPATASALRRLGVAVVRPAMEAHMRSNPTPDNALQSVPASGDDGPVVVGVGRLIEWKAYHLAIRAWARAGIPGTFQLFGAGPSLLKLKRIALQEGVSDRVIFHGHASREELFRVLAGARMLVHPSLHDSGGWAVLEAMQLGVPVVCWDHAGPGQQVDESCGIKVPVSSSIEGTPVDLLAAAIRELAVDDALHALLSQGARRRISEHFTWDRHALMLTEVYEELVGAGAQRQVAL